MHFLESDNKQVEIGCTLDKHFQNKGYETEVLKAVIDYWFNTLDKHLITSIDPGNRFLPLSRANWIPKGGALFVESLFVNGGWVDDLIYAMLQKE